MPPASNKDEPKGSDFFSSKILLILLVVLGLVWLVKAGMSTFEGRTRRLELSEFKQLVREERVADCRIIQGDSSTELRGSFREGENLGAENFEVSGPHPQATKDIEQLLEEHRVKYSFETASRFLHTLLPSVVIPLVVVGLLLYLMFRKMYDAGGGGALSFGKARARLVTKESISVTFEDVAGIEEAKEEVKEIVEFLKHPEKFRRIGARIPRGIILVGAPGTGKTLLAKAISGEAGVPFFSMSGSDFVEMFVGVGASRVRDLFQQAKRNAPAIIFLDEIDAVGRRRGTGLGGGHDEREQTLNAILVEMDGFDTSDQVIVIAATNRPDVLDPALLRPGRFDRHVVVDMPDVAGREAILNVHARKVRMAEGVELSVLARSTVSFSGADLENLINEAALIAVMHEHEDVQMEDLEEAREKVMWGKERRSRKLEETDRRVTAYHEAGHAVCAWFTPQADKPHKITIMPRGTSFLGATMKLPEKERYIFTRRQLEGELAVLYGGRAAEERFFDDLSVGASDDIRRATELIRKMVMRWGMSEKLGPIAFSDEEDQVFLGYEITRQRQNSEATNQEIDREIRQITLECHRRARGLVDAHASEIERIAKVLLEKEVMGRDDIGLILGPSAADTNADSPAAPGGRDNDTRHQENAPPDA